MASEPQPSEGVKPRNPSHFVIMLDSDRFVICERAIAINTHEDSATAEFLRSYIEKNRLDAAPLPGWTFNFDDGRESVAEGDSESGDVPMRATSMQAGRFSGQAGKYVFNFYDD